MTERSRPGRTPLRVPTPTAKAGIVIGGYILLVLVGLLVALSLGGVAGSVVAAAIDLAIVAFCSRVFRGGDEAVVPPRAWWRMTAGPVAGWVLAGLFTASAVSAWVAQATAGSGAVAATAQTVVAAALVHSAVRLSSRGRLGLMPRQD